MNGRPIDSRRLHPRILRKFVKRPQLGTRLRLFLSTTHGHSIPPSRVLLTNPPNLNGAALTVVITGRLRIPVHIASNPTIRRTNSLTSVLDSLSANRILFVSRVRHLPHTTRRLLCVTVRSFHISIVINGKPNTDSVPLALPHFAIVNTAAHRNVLPDPLHTHFNFATRLSFCPRRRLRGLVRHSTDILKIGLSRNSTRRLTLHSHNAPHVTGHLLHHIES